MSQQPTVARPTQSGSSHWYTLTGDACHSVPKKDGGGTRPTTLTDARKLNLVPSVTSIIQLLDKPALNLWKQEQVALAVLTTPRKENEADDAFVHRVLHEEKQQEQESQVAKDRGSSMHDGIEGFFSGLEVPAELEPWIRPVLDRLLEYGQKASAEIILIGDDYGGMADLLQDCGDFWRLWDFKCTKNLPDPAKGAWMEHRLQLAAYAQAFKNKLQRAGQVRPIIVGNIYISTVKEGEFVAIEHENWEDAYTEGFAPLVRHWQFVKAYRPNTPGRAATQASADVVSHYQVENGKLRQEVEDLKAKLASAEAFGAGTAKAAIALAKGLPVEEAFEPRAPEKDPNAPAVIPETVKGRKVAWTSATAPQQQAQPVPMPVPAPMPTGPGRPSPMVDKGPGIPPGVTPRTLVNGPNGPVMQ